MGLEIILNVLQGIVLIGLRECGELQLEKESLQSIRGAMEEAWVVEVRTSESREPYPVADGLSYRPWSTFYPWLRPFPRQCYRRMNF